MKKSDKLYLLGLAAIGIGVLCTYTAGTNHIEEQLDDCIEQSNCGIGVFRRKGRYIQIGSFQNDEDNEKTEEE